MKHTHLTGAAALCALLALAPARASAGAIGTEGWLGGGMSWPDYRDTAVVCARGGLGLTFMDHFGLGISGQADRERVHYFGNASVVLVPVGLLEPYGRFEFGRRDDRDDEAWGWAAGVCVGDEAIRLYLEANQIVEPEQDFGVSLGVSFR